MVLLVAAVFLVVLVSTAIFHKLSSSGQHIWVCLESDWLDNISREKVHERLDFVHLRLHHLWYFVHRCKAFQKGISADAFSLKQRYEMVSDKARQSCHESVLFTSVCLASTMISIVAIP